MQALFLERGPNSNFNVQVLNFQRGPTTISSVQIKKSFKPTSIPKKLWDNISSKKFWKDSIKWEQIFIPNDNFLYQMNIFYTKWLFFRDWSVWFIDNLMKMPHLNRKYPSGTAKRRMKFKANLVFKSSWLLFMISCIPIKTWMWTNSVYQLPSILWKGKVWNFQRGKLCSLLMVNPEKWGVQIKKWRRCQLAIAQLLCVASLVFPPFSVFKVVYHEHPFAFLLLLFQSYRSLRNVCFGGRNLGLIKSAYHDWLSMMTSSEGPPF